MEKIVSWGVSPSGNRAHCPEAEGVCSTTFLGPTVRWVQQRRGQHQNTHLQPPARYISYYAVGETVETQNNNSADPGKWVPNSCCSLHAAWLPAQRLQHLNRCDTRRGPWSCTLFVIYLQTAAGTAWHWDQGLLHGWMAQTCFCAMPCSHLYVMCCSKRATRTSSRSLRRQASQHRHQRPS